MHTPYSYMRGFGPESLPIVHLGWGMLLVCGLVLAIIVLLLAIALFKRNRDDTYKTAPENPDKLPVAREGKGLWGVYIGVIISTLVLFGLTAWTMTTIASVDSAKTPVVSLNVTAHQWWWEVRYNNADPTRIFTTANEIHIPVGQPVEIHLAAADVIHSFWVPQLAGKMDVIPGVNNTLVLQADEPGDYFGECAEYCGMQHAHMALHVIAQTPADYAGWEQGQVAAAVSPSPDVLPGQQVFMNRCSVCHAVRGTPAGGILGPDLTHLMSRRTIAAGLLPNDQGNLTAWIQEPQALKPGNLMPQLALSSQDTLSVLAYLESLK
jgi:cytochrome c oxidase subunit 2